MFKFYKKDLKSNEFEIILVYKSEGYMLLDYSSPHNIEKIVEKELKESLFKNLKEKFLGNEDKIKEKLNLLRGNLSLYERNKIIDKLESKLFPNIKERIEKIPTELIE